MAKRKIILNAHVVTPGRDLGGAAVRIEGRRIAAVGTDVPPVAGDQVIAFPCGLSCSFLCGSLFRIHDLFLFLLVQQAGVRMLDVYVFCLSGL